MIDAERQVWCAAFGASFGREEISPRDEFRYAGTGIAPANVLSIVEMAKRIAHDAVAALGGPSSHLSADSMMVAVIAEHKLSREDGS